MPTGHPEHVLIVDDDYAVRTYFGTLLQRRNYRVSAAEDADGARSLISADCPDLVILDHHLPDCTGEQLLGELRGDQRTRQLPVIFLSTDKSAARFRAVMNLGADDYLTKPAKPSELFEAVSAQLTKHRRRFAPRAATAADGAYADDPATYGLAAARLRAARPPQTTGVPPEYRVVGVLGQGASATAYLARHQAQADDCVVKVIPLAHSPNADSAARFSREGRLLERIGHPNVVRLYAHGLQDGHAYLAMEYVAGGTLRHRLGQPWDPLEALGVVMKVARGLAAVHALGVVHRDLKPDNIMLREGGLEPVLLDFGVAKDLRDDHHLTVAGTILGTPNYMAPEIIAGQPVSPATDVYACGAMFYEMLTGSKPFVSGTIRELLHQHLKYPIPRLPRRQAAFQPLLDRLLAKSPQERPVDGAAMAMLLAEFRAALTRRTP
jgi:DNA-binding response OmpR family regulator/tRNA A-37 threonylcarbamoyl transferase component Bud32